MSYATDKQIAFIVSLVSQSAYPSVIDAINAYGLGIRTADALSVGEASEMIDFLTDKPHRATIAPVPVAKAKRVKLIGQSMTAPLTTGANANGRMGKLAATKKGQTGVVINDNGDRLDVQFADGSYATYIASFLTFAA